MGLRCEITEMKTLLKLKDNRNSNLILQYRSTAQPTNMKPQLLGELVNICTEIIQATTYVIIAVMNTALQRAVRR